MKKTLNLIAIATTLFLMIGCGEATQDRFEIESE